MRVPSEVRTDLRARWMSSGPPTTSPTARTEACSITVSRALMPSLRKSFASSSIEYIASYLGTNSNGSTARRRLANDRAPFRRTGTRAARIVRSSRNDRGGNASYAETLSETRTRVYTPAADFPSPSERSSHEKSRRKEVSPDKTRCHGSPARQHSTRCPASQTSKKVGPGKPHRGEHLHAAESDATRPKSVTARGPEQQAPWPAELPDRSRVQLHLRRFAGRLGQDRRVGQSQQAACEGDQHTDAPRAGRGYHRRYQQGLRRAAERIRAPRNRTLPRTRG